MTTQAPADVRQKVMTDCAGDNPQGPAHSITQRPHNTQDNSKPLDEPQARRYNGKWNRKRIAPRNTKTGRKPAKMLYTDLHKTVEKGLYNNALAPLVQRVQNTQDVFDVSMLIYAQNNSFTNRYGLIRNKTPI